MLLHDAWLEFRLNVSLFFEHEWRFFMQFYIDVTHIGIKTWIETSFFSSRFSFLPTIRFSYVFSIILIQRCIVEAKFWSETLLFSACISTISIDDAAAAVLLRAHSVHRLKNQSQNENIKKFNIWDIVCS